MSLCTMDTISKRQWVLINTNAKKTEIKDNGQENCFKLLAAMIGKNDNSNSIGMELLLKEHKDYKKVLCKYAYIFVFSYKDLGDLHMEVHQIELFSNAK